MIANRLKSVSIKHTNFKNNLILKLLGMKKFTSAVISGIASFGNKKNLLKVSVSAPVCKKHVLPVVTGLLLLLMSLVSVNKSFAANTVAYTGSAPAAANVCPGATVILQQFQVVNGTTAHNITNVTFTTAGTYVAADITQFQLYQCTSAAYSLTGATLLATIAAAGPGGQTGATAVTALATSGTTYYVITTTIAAAPVNGHTIDVAAIAAPGVGNPFILSGAAPVYSGSIPVGGIMTMLLPPTGVTANATPNPICPGQNLTLTGAATGATSYAWSGPGGTAITSPTSLSTNVAGVVAGNAGVYTLTASNGGCTTTATSASVVISAAPTGVTASATPNPICVGQNLTLTGAATGASGYAWSGPGGTAITAPASLSTGVAGVVAGNAGVYILTATNGTCVTTATSTAVTVNALPTAISGPSVVCVSASITLTDGTAGGIWTSTAGSGTANVGTASGIVTGLTAGTVTISYTMGGCTPATYIITVNPNPSPITGPGAVCVGGTITLSDVTLGGIWSSTSANASIGSGNGIVSGVGTGTATISYNVSGCAVSTTITVNPNPNPISGPISVCIGYTITLSDIGVGTWSSSTPAVATVGSTTGIVSGIASGGTYVTFTFNSTGCFSSVFETVNTNPSAISGSNSVCLNYTTTLSDANVGGTWTSSTPGIASVGSGTGVVTGNLLGSATITYTIPTGCFVTQLMTVNPNPGIISGSPIVCQGSTTTLTDGTAGGAWSSGSFWVASIGSSGVVTGIIGGGTTTISYTLGTGCFATFTESVITPPSMITGDTTLCVGDSTALFDSVAGGVWSSSATGSLYIIPGTDTVVASALALSGVTVFYTITGCPAVGHTITINPIPAAITGASSLCDSVHSNLYDLTPGGVWSSNNTITARIDSLTGIATGVSLGTTIITYTLPTGCYTTLHVTVNPLAPPITGTDTICSTGSVWLTDIVGGGIWSSSNPAIGTIDPTSGLLTGIVTGITYIVYTLPTGCSASLLEHVIPPVAPISAPTHICTGSAVNITDADSNGVWSSSNNYIASVGTDGLLSGHFPDTAAATIIYTISAFKGCYATTSILVNPLPTPVITRSIPTHSVSTYSYYVNYQWSHCRTGAIGGATTPTLPLPYVNDSVFVTVTDTNGCTSSSSCYFYDYTGVRNVSATTARIFPNPASSILYIDANAPVRAIISAIDGRKVMEQANAKEMNISTLTPGMYLIALYDNEGQVVMMQKMIKE